MRVTCADINEFLENLEAAEGVFQNTVRISIVPRPIDENKADIVLQASAVVEVDDGSQFLLEAAHGCGRDYMEGGDRDLSGTNEAKRLKHEIAGLVQRKGWKVMPGIIGF